MRSLNVDVPGVRLQRNTSNVFTVFGYVRADNRYAPITDLSSSEFEALVGELSSGSVIHVVFDYSTKTGTGYHILVKVSKIEGTIIEVNPVGELSMQYSNMGSRFGGVMVAEALKKHLPRFQVLLIGAE